MNPRLVLTSLLLLLFSVVIVAQNQNPYKSIGKKGKILTLSKGRYEELFDQDSIQQIGTVLVNVRQMKVVKLLKEEDAQKLLDNSTGSRFLSVDPLTYGYPELTPYQFASNRPIDGIDRDGLEFEPYWATTVPQKDAALKAKLSPEEYKRLDRRGLFFVGGGLAGSFAIGLGVTAYTTGALLTVTTSPQIISTAGSISTIAAKYGPDIANFVYGATTGDATEPIPSNNGSQAADAGLAFRNLFKKGNVILDFFGGTASRFKDGVSIDLKADVSLGGFKGTIEQFAELFKGNKFKQIMAENPFGSYDYIKAAGELLEKGGTITVKGSSNNKYFNKLLNGTIEGIENFTIESKKLIEPLGKTTEGKIIENKDYYEIILKRN